MLEGIIVMVFALVIWPFLCDEGDHSDISSKFDDPYGHCTRKEEE